MLSSKDQLRISTSSSTSSRKRNQKKSGFAPPSSSIMVYCSIMHLFVFLTTVALHQYVTTRHNKKNLLRRKRGAMSAGVVGIYVIRILVHGIFFFCSLYNMIFITSTA